MIRTARAGALAIVVATGAGAVQSATFNFCWLGAGGYSMTGRITFPDALMAAPVITEREVTAFSIIGYQQGVAIGSWDMADRRAGTTWHLRFVPATLTFPTGGSFAGEESQGWNANGQVNDCGDTGFGFNSGNYAQDICLYGVYIEQSSIDPFTPLRATTDPVTPTCADTPLLGKRAEGG